MPIVGVGVLSPAGMLSAGSLYRHRQRRAGRERLSTPQRKRHQPLRLYGLPLPAVRAGPPSANTRFASWSPERNIAACLSGSRDAPENWQHAQNRLADWLQALPPQTGIIAVTDARARHVLQACERSHYSGTGKSVRYRHR